MVFKKPKKLYIEIKGIKCDHCDYRDDTVNGLDIFDYINEPCPKCGANLLTEKDVNLMLAINRILKFLAPLNWLCKKFGVKTTKYRITSNGAGEVQTIQIQE